MFKGSIIGCIVRSELIHLIQSMFLKVVGSLHQYHALCKDFQNVLWLKSLSTVFALIQKGFVAQTYL